MKGALYSPSRLIFRLVVEKRVRAEEQVLTGMNQGSDARQATGAIML